MLSGAFNHVLQYVETLSEQLEGLRQSPTDRCKWPLVACTMPEQTCRSLTQLCRNLNESTCRVDDAVLQQYQEHVQRLSQQLQEPSTAAAAAPSKDAAQLREARAELFS